VWPLILAVAAGAAVAPLVRRGAWLPVCVAAVGLCLTALLVTLTSVEPAARVAAWALVAAGTAAVWASDRRVVAAGLVAIGAAGLVVAHPLGRSLEVRAAEGPVFNDPPPPATEVQVRGGTLSLGSHKLFIFAGEMGDSTSRLTARWVPPLGVVGEEHKIADTCGTDEMCPILDGRQPNLVLEPAGAGRARMVATHPPGVRLIPRELESEAHLRAWVITVGPLQWWRFAFWAAFVAAVVALGPGRRTLTAAA
jgi:hypothetical protein